MKDQKNYCMMMLNTGDVARIFEVHSGTIRRWCRDGQLRSYRYRPLGRLRFLREDVAAAYLDKDMQQYFRRKTDCQ